MAKTWEVTCCLMQRVTALGVPLFLDIISTEMLQIMSICSRSYSSWVGQLPDKGRYGYAASTKPRSGKYLKNIIPKQKVPQNLMLRQIFMHFIAQKSEFLRT